MGDPYAEFGGSQSGAPSTDPYAEFEGKAALNMPSMSSMPGAPSTQPMKEMGITVPNAGRIPGQMSPGNEVSDQQAAGGLAAGAVAGAAPLVAGAALPVARTAMAKHPLITSMALSEGISQARKIPYVGKLVPPYAEMLPFLKGGSPAAEAEGAAGAEAASGSKIPVGKLPKPTADPYSGPRIPEKMELVDSTTVSKVGYHPDSQTMTIEYRSGGVYSYSGVPKEIYQQAKDAPSIGSFVARNIKGRYGTNFRGSVLGKK